MLDVGDVRVVLGGHEEELDALEELDAREARAADVEEEADEHGDRDLVEDERQQHREAAEHVDDEAREALLDGAAQARPLAWRELRRLVVKRERREVRDRAHRRARRHRQPEHPAHAAQHAHQHQVQMVPAALLQTPLRPREHVPAQRQRLQCITFDEKRNVLSTQVFVTNIN